MGIKEHLEDEQNKEYLRFSTAGSVDDGKSTLIGRLLHDSKSVYEDQVLSIKKASKDAATIDWALLTDGLKAEREQGITIDVAYRYFATARRKFIIADTPGHEQYTRNMVTGASTADLTIILIDARNGVVAQSKRHAFIASLLQIPHMVVAVNKMDLVDYSEEVFNNIVDEFSDFSAKFQVNDIRFMPMSALMGDNVVHRSKKMPWYKGESLMELLDTIYIASDRNLVDLRFPVQYVLRPNQDFRGYAGQVASGILRKGDEVMSLPSMKTSRVESIVTWNGEMEEAFPPHSVTVTLEDEIDVSRGDMLVAVQNRPKVSRQFEAMIVWMDEEPLDPNARYYLKQGTMTTQAVITDIRYRVDINTLSREEADTLKVNEIGRLSFVSHQPLMFDPYDRNRATGSFILVDAISNHTAAAGMIIDREPTEELPMGSRSPGESVSPRIYQSKVSSMDRVRRLGHQPLTIWMTGLVSAGKSEIAYALEKELFDLGMMPTVLRGGDIRRGLSSELKFNPGDVVEHIRRAAETARAVNEAGLISICSFVSPLASHREQAREIIGADRFVEVYLNVSAAWCAARDETGLYKRASQGEVTLPGFNAPYQEPKNPDIVLDLDRIRLQEAIASIVKHVQERHAG